MLVLWLSGPAAPRAHADDVVSASNPPAPAEQAPQARSLRAPELTLAPDFQRVRPWQYALLAALVLENGYRGIVGYDVERDARFGGPWPPLDGALHDALFVDDPGARQDVEQASDLLWHATLFFPIYADALGAALIAHGEPEVAFQLTAIGGQAILIVSLLNWATRTLVRRERPIFYEARRRGETAETNKAAGGGFFSGHAALAFTGAGLACAYHERLPLFGGGAADDAACIGTLGAATAVGVSRLLGGTHYASDVLIGSTLGLSVGIGLPLLLHFGRGDGDGDARALWLLPAPGAGGEPGARLIVVF